MALPSVKRRSCAGGVCEYAADHDDEEFRPVELTFASYNVHLFGRSFAAWLPRSAYHDDLRASVLGSRLRQDLTIDVVAFQEMFDVRYLAGLSSALLPATYRGRYHTRDLLTMDEMRALVTNFRLRDHFPAMQTSNSPAAMRQEEYDCPLVPVGGVPHDERREEPGAHHHLRAAIQIHEEPATIILTPQTSAAQKSTSAKNEGEREQQPRRAHASATTTAASTTSNVLEAATSPEDENEFFLESDHLQLQPHMKMINVANSSKMINSTSAEVPRGHRYSAGDDNLQQGSCVIAAEASSTAVRQMKVKYPAYCSSGGWSTTCGSSSDSSWPTSEDSPISANGGDDSEGHDEVEAPELDVAGILPNSIGQSNGFLRRRKFDFSAFRRVEGGVKIKGAPAGTSSGDVADHLSVGSKNSRNALNQEAAPVRHDVPSPTITSTRPTEFSSAAHEQLQVALQEQLNGGDASSTSLQGRRSTTSTSNCCSNSNATSISKIATQQGQLRLPLPVADAADKDRSLPEEVDIGEEPCLFARAGHHQGAGADSIRGKLRQKEDLHQDALLEGEATSATSTSSAADVLDVDDHHGVGIPFPALAQSEIFGTYEPANLPRLRRLFRSHCSLRDGLFLLSKHETAHALTVALEATGGVESVVRRGVQCVYLPQFGFCVFNLHAHYGGNLRETKTRMKNILQLREIVDLYRLHVKNLEDEASSGASSRMNFYDGRAYVLLGDLNIIYESETYAALLKVFPECGDADCGGAFSCDPDTNDLIKRFEPWLDHERAKLDYVLYTKEHFSEVESRVRSDLRFAVPGSSGGGGGERVECQKMEFGCLGGCAAGSTKMNKKASEEQEDKTEDKKQSFQNISDHYMVTAKLRFKPYRESKIRSEKSD